MSQTPQNATKLVALFDAVTKTATATSSTVDTGLRSGPIVGGQFGYTRAATMFLSVASTAGTTPTLDMSLQGSVDGGTTWHTLNPCIGTASAVWTQATTVSNQVRHYEGPLPAKLRSIATIGGSSPTVVFTSYLLLEG